MLYPAEYPPVGGVELRLDGEQAVRAVDCVQTIATALEALDALVYSDDTTGASGLIRIGREAMADLVGLVRAGVKSTSRERREGEREDESTDRGRRHAVHRRVVDGIGSAGL